MAFGGIFLHPWRYPVDIPVSFDRLSEEISNYRIKSTTNRAKSVCSTRTLFFDGWTWTNDVFLTCYVNQLFFFDFNVIDLFLQIIFRRLVIILLLFVLKNIILFINQDKNSFFHRSILYSHGKRYTLSFVSLPLWYVRFHFHCVIFEIKQVCFYS